MTYISFAYEGYIILSDIELPNLPDSVQIEGLTLRRKNEFHITLVGSKALTYLPEGSDAAQLMREAVNEFASTNDILTYEILKTYRLVKREDRVTIAVMARVENIDKLYEFLNAKFNTNIPTQPAHATIYSLDPDVGISINSEEELADTKIVDMPELAVDTSTNE